jgi:hypothetical protein
MIEVLVSNAVPLAVRRKAGPPATALFGVTLVRVIGGAVTVKGSGDGEGRPGSDTATDTLPDDAIRLAGMLAVS